MSDQPQQFDVFLCHNGRDKPAVREISEKLKTKGLRPWLDEDQLQPGIPWQPILEEQIESIRSAAVLVGKDGIGPWQELELQTLLRQFVNRRVPVIPVLLKDAPEKPVIPLFLRNNTLVDFRKPDPDPMEQLFFGITGRRTKEERSTGEDQQIGVTRFRESDKQEETRSSLRTSVYSRQLWIALMVIIAIEVHGTKASYERLYRQLTHQQETPKPDLGKRLVLKPRDRPAGSAVPLMCSPHTWRVRTQIGSSD